MEQEMDDGMDGRMDPGMEMDMNGMEEQSPEQPGEVPQDDAMEMSPGMDEPAEESPVQE